MGRMSEASARIVVGYNGTPASHEAVDWAAAQAAARGAELRILCCYDVPAAADSLGLSAADSVSALLDAARQLAESAARTVADAHPGLAVQAASTIGPASRVLVEQSSGAELLVLGTSDHHGLIASWLGSTPRYVVRRAACPVAVVRGAAGRGRPDRVVVGVDDSAPARRAVEWAAAEADRHQVPLLLVHAWWYQYGGGSAVGRDLTRVDAGLVLERAEELAREQFLGTVTAELREADPVPALLDAVRDGDLLVVAASGRGAIARGLLGSTVNGVLEAAAVPAVVVPSDRG
jgi:nucleotide-binding universal stress UspA family protein